MNTTRAEILSLLNGEKLASPPVFSGLIHVTREGLQREGLSLHEVHHDARKMAIAAAGMFKLTGLPSATLPLDLCAPAEMLGAELKYEGEGFPQVKKAVVESGREIGGLENWRPGIGRLEIVCEAIRLVKDDIGKDIVISGMIPGPYTLLLYLCNPGNLFVEMKKEPQIVLDALFHLSSFLLQIGHAFREAGADFITIHDMGGSPGFIGPARYEQFVFPAEKDLIGRLPKPRVLSVCGNVNKSLHLLAGTGVDALSVDQLADLKMAREALKDTLLFGNIDPVQTLWRGDEADITEAVREAQDAGVDAIWPGCDLVPQTSTENLRALMG
jgi:[methyl-Co(III) methanol-specific corrinoid protein]:coenzyme M methyltransferase